MYKRIYRFIIVNLLYLDGFELNYLSIYKYDLEGVYIFVFERLEIKVVI